MNNKTAFLGHLGVQLIVESVLCANGGFLVIGQDDFSRPGKFEGHSNLVTPHGLHQEHTATDQRTKSLLLRNTPVVKGLCRMDLIWVLVRIFGSGRSWDSQLV